ncbi:MAG: helix-turn-helix domain-containing protein [Acidimicrobiia bacterium]|nr:helix-turn-helix domain-containing protein [Acidimicrobiia bacterium]
MTTSESRRDHRGDLGAFIRAQRRLAELSQRELAKIADVSDAYVSQLERGMHEPTVKVLRSIAAALDIRANTMLHYAGWLEEVASDEADGYSEAGVETAIRSDRRLTEQQKQAMLSVYRGFIEASDEP